MRVSGVVACVLLSALSVAQAKPSQPSDDEIASRIIAESIASYSGACPCPYNQARNGSSCGRRSAYSRPGGFSPKCYRDDVTVEDIRQYKQRLRQP
ncbi:hypothetical protein [Pseudomonas sp. RIT-PI-S]|uniref:hypothetical protein n=1 Tax=Pseudomonas sp. RIT-PI-S TaxID=3035295 RepID=UPI0021D92B8A|nr:hypothetical protein [Pseudomonas sp. RIT-PI-S]